MRTAAAPAPSTVLLTQVRPMRMDQAILHSLSVTVYRFVQPTRERSAGHSQLGSNVVYVRTGTAAKTRHHGSLPTDGPRPTTAGRHPSCVLIRAIRRGYLPAMTPLTVHATSGSVAEIVRSPLTHLSFASFRHDTVVATLTAPSNHLQVARPRAVQATVTVRPVHKAKHGLPCPLFRGVIGLQCHEHTAASRVNGPLPKFLFKTRQSCSSPRATEMP